MDILVAYDGSEGSRRTLREAAPLARAAGGTVILVRILDPRVDAADVTADSTAAAMVVVEKRALAEMHDAAVGLDVQSRAVVVTQERGEDTSEALIRAARAEGADIIAIATRRATGLSGVLLGSVTQGVLKNASIPVLVIRVG